MSNRTIHIEQLFHDEGFRIALRRALCETPSPYGLAYYLDVDPEDVTWDVYPASAEDIAYYMKRKHPAGDAVTRP